MYPLHCPKSTPGGWANSANERAEAEEASRPPATQALSQSLESPSGFLLRTSPNKAGASVPSSCLRALALPHPHPLRPLLPTPQLLLLPWADVTLHTLGHLRTRSPPVPVLKPQDSAGLFDAPPTPSPQNRTGWPLNSGSP